MARIADFYTHTFPQEFRRSLPFFAICTALTVACAVVAYVLVRSHPNDAFALLPSGMIPDRSYVQIRDCSTAS